MVISFVKVKAKFTRVHFRTGFTSLFGPIFPDLSNNMAKAVTKTTGNSAKFLYSYRNSPTLNLISHSDQGKRTTIQNNMRQKHSYKHLSANRTYIWWPLLWFRCFRGQRWFSPGSLQPACQSDLEESTELPPKLQIQCINLLVVQMSSWPPVCRC